MRTILIIAAVAAVACEAHADIAVDALRATVRVDGGSQSGTAFLVAVPAESAASGTTLLVTAAHVFENMKAEACTVSFRAAEQDRFARLEARVAIREAERPLWIRHPDADVAILPVEPPAGADLTAFAASQIAAGSSFARGEVAVGQPVWVACFPAKTEANAAGWPILRRGTIASHPLAPIDRVKTFFVDYAHFGGDSGSAVVVDRGGAPLVAGLVIAMQRQTDHVTSPFEDKKVHTPLGLAIVAPADRILQVIDRWRRSLAAAPVPPGE
jgi:hypothetical protein